MRRRESRNLNRSRHCRLLGISLALGLAGSGLAGCHSSAPMPMGAPAGSGGNDLTKPGSNGTGGSGTGASPGQPSAAAPTLGATCAGEPLNAGDPADPGRLIGPSQMLVGPTTTQAVPPPAVSGGTLLALPDGQTVIAADPDRDQIYVVNVGEARVSFTVPLQPGDEPGRVVADGSGFVHVVLRRGGAVVTLDPTSGAITQRRQVCTAPRGLAHDSASDLLHVACAGGELVSLPAAGGVATRTLQLDRDLRDVVVQGDLLRVSRFRSGEILTVAGDGSVRGRAPLGDFRSSLTRGGQLFTSGVAWRMIKMPDGGVGVVHQRGVDDEVQHGARSSYGGVSPCHGIVHSAVTRMKADGSMSRGPALPAFPLAVDMAVSPDGKRVALISAGNGRSEIASQRPDTSVFVSGLDEISAEGRGCNEHPEKSPCDQTAFPLGSSQCRSSVPTVHAEAIAVAFRDDDSVIVQSREPAALIGTGGLYIELSTESRSDTGHRLFHANAGAGLACASCHPEGEEDGRTWNFACVGRRRTQSLQVGIRGTEPFHWEGDQRDFGALVRDVLTARMAGPALSPEQAETMLSWIDGQPRTRALPPASDSAAVARGRLLYNDATRAACATCHMGAQLTNSKTVDVGTGGAFQVPSLVGIGNHAPFMHNGCAKTLRDRFSPACGGGDKHGKTSGLSPTELSDLLTYLETL